MSIASGGQKHIKITSSLFALAIATVLLRFLARRRAKLHLGIDDWTLLTALALVLCIYIEGLVCTGAPLNQEKSPQFTSFVGVLLGGIGKHVTELSPSELTILLKVRETSLLPEDIFLADGPPVLCHRLGHLCCHVRRYQSIDPPPLYPYFPCSKPSCRMRHCWYTRFGAGDKHLHHRLLSMPAIQLFLGPIYPWRQMSTYLSCVLWQCCPNFASQCSCGRLASTDPLALADDEGT